MEYQTQVHMIRESKMLNSIQSPASTHYSYGYSNNKASSSKNTDYKSEMNKSDSTDFSPESLKKSADDKKLGVLRLDGKKFAELRDETQKMLIESLFKAQQSEQKDAKVKLIDPMLYDVSDTEKAAEVPEYWNSENTSQRIVDFAMSFQEVSGEGYEEYLDKVRKAVEKGFKEAKDIMGSLSGPSAKLFNDTYEATMKKFDDLLKNYKDSQSLETPEESEKAVDSAKSQKVNPKMEQYELNAISPLDRPHLNLVA